MLKYQVKKRFMRKANIYWAIISSHKQIQQLAIFEMGLRVCYQ